jgi:hypothetical protein
MAKKNKKAPVEFPVLNVKLEGKSRSFAIVKHAVKVPKFQKTFTAEQLQEKENAAVVAHLIKKGCSILKEIPAKAGDGDAAEKAAKKAADKADKAAAKKAADKADKAAAKKAADKADKAAAKADAAGKKGGE